jgi:hypothetical protein
MAGSKDATRSLWINTIRKIQPFPRLINSPERFLDCGDCTGVFDASNRQHGGCKSPSLCENVRDLRGQSIWKVVRDRALQISHPVVVARLVSRVVVVRRPFAAHSRPFQLEDVHGLSVAAAAQVLLARGERHRGNGDASLDSATEFEELCSVVDLERRKNHVNHAESEQSRVAYGKHPDDGSLLTCRRNLRPI